MKNNEKPKPKKIYRAPKKKLEPLASPLVNRRKKSAEEIARLFTEFQEALASEKPDRTEKARLEFVETLMSQGYRRGAIVRLVGKAFGKAAITIDRDIARAKEHFVNYVIKQSHADHLGQAVARMVDTYHNARRAGDRPAAVAAAKHLDEMLGLKENVIKLIGDKDKPLEVKKHEHDAGDAAAIIEVLLRTGALKSPTDPGDKAKT